MAERAVRVLVDGRVQGVWFRDSTRREAERLGLTGWVRNRRDGRVEALLQGPEPALTEMLRWCSDGPPLARVDGVQTTDEPCDADIVGFEVRPTSD